MNAKPEGYEFLHDPKSERRGDDEIEGAIYRSSGWLAFENGSIQPHLAALERWMGKRARVQGIAQTKNTMPIASREFHHHGGFGPPGFWPARLEPYSIQRVTSEIRREEIV
ncbi:hypothetical protein [Acidovorax kalamii]|uniref:hypothetical protein n=1 Tax=Acidovorax kalamii TaxID=2004485 RepID=UPI00209147EC|nr:hypothetical protein [Acidovorax kalamii]MCO5358773.1 hypothetical protein [Acidovorax kalamii]